METSAYLHIYWNKLHTPSQFVGIYQYDMIQKKKYENLDKSTIYILASGHPIFENGAWNTLMFPRLRNLAFLLEHYNNTFKTEYSPQDLTNLPLSLWQTNIYPIDRFEKLCFWLEALVQDIYPWCTQPPYETHFGSVSGYTERAISLFNALEIKEGAAFESLQFSHEGNLRFTPQHYQQSNSILNTYSQDIHTDLLNGNPDILSEYTKIENSIYKAISFIREQKNDITYIRFVIYKNALSKPIMMLINNTVNLKRYENILHDDLSLFDLYYKKIYDNEFIICLTQKNRILYTWNIRMDITSNA